MIGIVDLGKWCGAAQYGRSCSNNSNFCCGGLFFSIFCSCSKSFWDSPPPEVPGRPVNPKTRQKVVVLGFTPSRRPSRAHQSQNDLEQRPPGRESAPGNARQHAKAHPATPARPRKCTRGARNRASPREKGTALAGNAAGEGGQAATRAVAAETGRWRRRQGTPWRIRATLGNVRGGTASAVGPKRSEAIRQGVPAKPQGITKPAREGSVLLNIVCAAAGQARQEPQASTRLGRRAAAGQASSLARR